MGMFQIVRFGLGIILFLSLTINFFYRGIQFFRQVHKNNYSEDVSHTFNCRNCEEIYQLNGQEVQERVSIWSTKLEKRTPKGQSSAIRFICPHCHEKAFQYRVFDTDRTALFGNIRAQLNESSGALLKELLIKGSSQF